MQQQTTIHKISIYSLKSPALCIEYCTWIPVDMCLSDPQHSGGYSSSKSLTARCLTELTPLWVFTQVCFMCTSIREALFLPAPPSIASSSYLRTLQRARGYRSLWQCNLLRALGETSCYAASLDKVKMSWAKPQSTASSLCRGDLPSVTNDDQHFPWASSKLDRWQYVLWTGARSICLAFQIRGLKLKAKHARSCIWISHCSTLEGI